MVYSFEASGNFAPTFVSDNIKRVLGYETDDYLKQPDFWRNNVHPEDLAAVEAGQAKLFEEERHVAEYRFRKKDGIYCWVSDDQHLVRDQNGKPLEVIGSWSEVTARKTAEQQALAESEQRLTDAIEIDLGRLLAVRQGGPAGSRQLQICRAVRSWRRAAQTRHDLRGDHPARGRCMA